MGLRGHARSLARPLVWTGRRMGRRLGELLRPPRRWDGRHHPVFAQFPRWRGESDGTFVHDFLGVRTDPRFRPQFRPDPPGPLHPDYPMPQASYFEWVFVLQAVLAGSHGEDFGAVELGAGYAPWLVTVHAALRGRSPMPLRLVGVEMVPRHHGFMLEHFRNNGIDPERHVLLNAAVSDVDGEVDYVPEPEPGLGFGQALRRRYPGRNARPPRDPAGTVRVPCIALTRLLADVGRVNLMHVDTQGEEARSIPSAAGALRDKVEHLLIATHRRRTHRALRALLLRDGWRLVFDYGVRSRSRTEFGDVRFLDGLLAAVNPRLSRSRT